MLDAREGLRLIRQNLKRAHNREVWRIHHNKGTYAIQAQNHIVDCLNFIREIEHHVRAIEDIELRIKEVKKMAKKKYRAQNQQLTGTYGK